MPLLKKKKASELAAEALKAGKARVLPGPGSAPAKQPEPAVSNDADMDDAEEALPTAG